MEAQHQQLAEQEEKLGQTLQALQQRVNTFRTQKEVLKAQYTAAAASASVNEDVAGISSTLGDSGAALQRAQDKIATMQARAGALDELLQSGVLEDVGGNTDDIQQELDEAGTAADVDRELAAMKAEIGPGSTPPELTSGSELAEPPRQEPGGCAGVWFCAWRPGGLFATGGRGARFGLCLCAMIWLAVVAFPLVPAAGSGMSCACSLSPGRSRIRRSRRRSRRSTVPEAGGRWRCRSGTGWGVAGG